MRIRVHSQDAVARGPLHCVEISIECGYNHRSVTCFTTLIYSMSPFRHLRASHMAPPGETGQENLYLRSLSERQIPVTVLLRDGETVSGWIEYFDDCMIRLTREHQPNLFIYKQQIRSIVETSHRRSQASAASRQEEQ